MCGMIDGSVVMFGGTNWENNTKQWLDEIWSYHEKKMTWLERGRLPHPMAYAAAGSTDRGIYFVGGSDGTNALQDISLLDADFNVNRMACISQRFVYSGAVLTDSEFFILSGTPDASDLGGLTGQFFVIDTLSGRTRQLPDYPGGKLALTALAMLDGFGYAFGGSFFQSPEKVAVNVNSAFAFSIRKGEWNEIKSYPFPVRGVAACALNDRYIFLGGGYKTDSSSSASEGFTDKAYLYDVKENAYIKTEPVPLPTVGHLVKAGKYLYWLGGEDARKSRSHFFHRIEWQSLLNEVA